VEEGKRRKVKGKVIGGRQVEEGKWRKVNVIGKRRKINEEANRDK